MARGSPIRIRRRLSPCPCADMQHPSSSRDYTVGASSSEAASLTGVQVRAASDRYLRDAYGRYLLIRGCSVSGLNKLPTGPQAGYTHVAEGFFDHEDVTFVGRPFPLDEACVWVRMSRRGPSDCSLTQVVVRCRPDHFARLQQWGLTFIRLVIPWESLEHSGP